LRPKTFARAALVLASLLATANHAHAAGAPYRHDRLYVHGEIVAGPSWLSYRAPLNTGVIHSGEASGKNLGLVAAVGWTLPSGLVLGGALLIQVQPEPSFDNPSVKRGWDDTSAGVAALAALARLYPNPRAGLHFELLAGPASYRVRQRAHIDGPGLACPVVFPECWDDHTRTLEKQERSAGVLLGAAAGYDFWLSHRFSLSITARFSYARTWSDESRYTLWLPTLGIGGTWN
jgi:hypothetical protein